MKKRIASVFLLFALVLTILPVSVLAAEPTVPIYIGYDDVDYMAEEILKEIPTEGKTPREQIRAVWDWVLENCQHAMWESPLPEGYPFFDEAQVAEAAKGIYQDAVKNGRIALRLELENQVIDAMAMQDGLNYPCDTNEMVAAYAKDIMIDHSGDSQEYAALMTVLLSHLGFDVRLVSDVTPLELENGIQAEPMYWNYVLLDGHYYLLDAYMAQEPGLKADDYFMKPYDHYKDGALYYHPLEASAKNGFIAEFYEKSIALASNPWGRCSNWALDYMNKAGEIGLISEELAGERLDAPISRSEFAYVAVKLYEAFAGEAPAYIGENPFIDTMDEAVLQAYGLGIVNGVGNGAFAPEATLSREQAVTMLGRAYEVAKTGAISGGATLEAPECSFPDYAATGDYAKPYVNFFVAGAIVDGMSGGIFGPLVTMTREQAIKVAVVAVEKLG